VNDGYLANSGPEGANAAPGPGLRA